MPTGGWEWLLILGAAVLLFGAAKLPELAKAVGKSLGEFKKGQREVELELKSLDKPLTAPVQAESEIRKLAREMGINAEGKTDDQLKEEIKTLKAGK